ncbi:MAG: DUF4382 domain-containing protein [bacterium]|nr:DUF4382 domain-containing protein [bacterium]
MKHFKLLAILILLFSIIKTGCKKDDDDTLEVVKATFKMGITDSRDAHSKNLTDNGIIDPAKLTKLEVTISSIDLKQSDDTYLNVLSEETTINLRDFKGTVRELLNVQIPVGTYKSIKVTYSGVSTTYDGNNYTASISGGASVTLTGIPYTFTEEHGVENVFSGEISIEFPVEFFLDTAEDIQGVRLLYDAEASAYEIGFTYNTTTYLFAGLHQNPSISIILENGIQQIKHSPPLGITISGSGDVDYYGIHTFYDFNQLGGTINSHTSQHMYRGADGSLLVEAEDMAVNSTALVPNTVSATGESGIRADETFKYSTIRAKLEGDGHTFESGKKYYFSLRKTWNISTNDGTYEITRTCEPVAILFP